MQKKSTINKDEAVPFIKKELAVYLEPGEALYQKGNKTRIYFITDISPVYNVGEFTQINVEYYSVIDNKTYKYDFHRRVYYHEDYSELCERVINTIRSRFLILSKAKPNKRNLGNKYEEVKKLNGQTKE